MKKVRLTDEQVSVVTEVTFHGNNVVVDACIGSGKTTLLEKIYEMSRYKRVVYLTYNKLLKQEAQARLEKRPGCIIQNYHGFVYTWLMKAGYTSSIDTSLSLYVEAVEAGDIKVPKYDVLLIDEYQDINEEMAGVLECIKKANKDIRIVAVGDMKQKIYNNTRLDIEDWLENFMGEHTKLSLTKCFRLGEAHAGMLGRVWGKSIEGVNKEFSIEVVSVERALSIAEKLEPSKVIALGKRVGALPEMLNYLESEKPEKYNKNTVYATIKDRGDMAKDIRGAAIFTTYDSAKGMEREHCFLFDFDYHYWNTRNSQAGSNYELLKNIFCVAASRGSKKLYIVKGGSQTLTESKLKMRPKDQSTFGKVVISEMADHKHRELLVEAYNKLEVRLMRGKKRELKANLAEGYIDLAPCVGQYQELVYFENIDTNKSWETYGSSRFKDKLRKHLQVLVDSGEELGIRRHTLYLTALATKQERYLTQVEGVFMEESEENELIKRLSRVLPRDANVQVDATFKVNDILEADDIPEELKKHKLTFSGRCDALHNGRVYELKFAHEIGYGAYLQCAAYLVGLGMREGIVWNTRTDEQYLVRIPDRKEFVLSLMRLVTGS